MRLVGSAPKSHLCDQRRRGKMTGLSDLMTLFIDLGCLYFNQTQRTFNVFKNTLHWLKIDSVDQKFNWVWELLTRCWNVWHWESYCVFTAGGERVKNNCMSLHWGSTVNWFSDWAMQVSYIYHFAQVRQIELSLYLKRESEHFGFHSYMYSHQIWCLFQSSYAPSTLFTHCFESLIAIKIIMF
jgi:hypothetical protein